MTKPDLDYKLQQKTYSTNLCETQTNIQFFAEKDADIDYRIRPEILQLMLFAERVSIDEAEREREKKSTLWVAVIRKAEYHSTCHTNQSGTYEAKRAKVSVGRKQLCNQHNKNIPTTREEKERRTKKFIRTPHRCLVVRSVSNASSVQLKYVSIAFRTDIQEEREREIEGGGNQLESDLQISFTH